MIADIAKITQQVLDLELDQSYFRPSVVGLPVEMMERPNQFLDGIRAKYGDVFLTDAGTVDGIHVDFGRFAEAEPDTPIYAVMGFDAVQKILLQNNSTFGQAHDHTFRKAWGDSVITLDPPTHTPIRALTVKALSKVAQWEEAIIAPACHYLADRIAEKGGGELVTQYSGILPLIVVAALLDLDMSEGRWLLDRINKVMAIAHDPVNGEVASAELRAMFSDIYDERQRHPGEDLVSELIAAEVDGQRLTKEQVLSFCRILMPAGFETTSKQFGHLLTVLLTRPELLAMVRDDRSLIAAAIDEVTRWESPLIGGPKRALRDVTLAGVDIPKGAALILFQGYADRDAGRWDQPHEFDLTRKRRASVAFGAGIHYCPGVQLARAEMAIGLSVLLDRFPDLRLADPENPPRILGFYSRVVSEINVLV